MSDRQRLVSVWVNARTECATAAHAYAQSRHPDNLAAWTAAADAQAAAWAAIRAYDAASK